MVSGTRLPVYDLSFLTNLTKLDVDGLDGDILTLPTSIVNLVWFRVTKRVVISDTQNLTRLEVTG